MGYLISGRWQVTAASSRRAWVNWLSLEEKVPDWAYAWREIRKREGKRLPHWSVDEGLYHVCFRLPDSLPNDTIGKLVEERRLLVAKQVQSEDDRLRANQISRTIDKCLDQGFGSCLMLQTQVAEIVKTSILHFDDERYDLFGWCIMPNHVRLVIQPKAGFQLGVILHSIKSFSENEINRAIGQFGPVWMKESFDHLIRSEASFRRHLEYVRTNPIKAGLFNWPWVG